MNKLAEALILAIHHIDSRRGVDDDSDVAALEEISNTLQRASQEEKSAFKISAQQLGYVNLPEEMGL
jgi:hypothetical protein